MCVTDSYSFGFYDLSYWGEPEQAPHWSVVEVYVGVSRCVWSVNKKSDRKAIQVLYTSKRYVVHGM